MLLQKRARDPESVADVLWGCVWAGLGAVLIGVLLLGAVYLFMPLTRTPIEGHLPYLLAGAVAFFFVGFGVSLQSLLEMQYWRGKWKWKLPFPLPALCRMHAKRRLRISPHGSQNRCAPKVMVTSGVSHVVGDYSLCGKLPIAGTWILPPSLFKDCSKPRFN